MEMKTTQRRYTHIYSLAIDLLEMRESNYKKMPEPCDLCVLYLLFWEMQVLQLHVQNLVLVEASSACGYTNR